MRRLLLVGALFFASTAIAATPRPKITGIAYVQFRTRSAESASFYGKLLGLSSFQGADETTSRLTTYIVGSSQRIRIDSYPPMVDGGPMIKMVGLETPDPKRMRTYLREHGYTKQQVIHGGFRVLGPENLWVAFVAPLHFSSPIANESRAVSTRIIHVGFVVHDRAAADVFFRDLLGFKLYWTGGPHWDGTQKNIFYASMQVPDGHEWVEYMLNRPPNMDAKGYGSANHVALGVVSIQEAVKQLRANGWKGTAEPRQGQDGKWQLNLFDPDGTRIELMEFTPTREPCCTKYQRPHPSPSER